jgi:hypothetical protein
MMTTEKIIIKEDTQKYQKGQQNFSLEEGNKYYQQWQGEEGSSSSPMIGEEHQKSDDEEVQKCDWEYILAEVR